MRLLTASLAAVLLAGQAPAQNAPLSGLPARGTVQASDIIPIQPAGGPQLMRTTVAAIGGAGAVTSVGLSLPAPFTCTGSPITGAGAISCAVAAQNANTVYAGPASGAAATPGFRALVSADLPASGVAAGTYGDYADVPEITFDATGRATSATTVQIALASNPYRPGVPQESAWTVLNGAALTVRQSAANGAGFVQALSLLSPYNTGSAALQGLCRAAPAAPYRVVVWMDAGFPSGSERGGVGFYDATSGRLELLTMHTGGALVPSLEKWNSLTSQASTADGSPANSNGWWLAIQSDGAAISFEVGNDGVNWLPFQTDTVSGGWMPNYGTLCLVIDPNISGAGTWYATFFTYDETGANRTLATVY